MYKNIKDDNIKQVLKDIVVVDRDNFDHEITVESVNITFVFSNGGTKTIQQDFQPVGKRKRTSKEDKKKKKKQEDQQEEQVEEPEEEPEEDIAEMPEEEEYDFDQKKQSQEQSDKKKIDKNARDYCYYCKFNHSGGCPDTEEEKEEEDKEGKEEKKVEEKVVEKPKLTLNAKPLIPVGVVKKKTIIVDDLSQ